MLPIAYAADPATPPAGSSFEARLAQRKAEQNITLEEKDQKRLEQTCVNVQSKIRTINQSATTVINDRNLSYKRVDAKLWVTIGRLKLATQDTFELEKQRTSFAQQINDFQTTGSNYTQTLDDIQLINCQADPVGFKALLETARFYHKQLISQANAVHAYVANDIKKTLDTHVSDLKPKAETN